MKFNRQTCRKRPMQLFSRWFPDFPQNFTKNQSKGYVRWEWQPKLFGNSVLSCVRCVRDSSLCESIEMVNESQNSVEKRSFKWIAEGFFRGLLVCLRFGRSGLGRTDMVVWCARCDWISNLLRFSNRIIDCWFLLCRQNGPNERFGRCLEMHQQRWKTWQTSSFVAPMLKSHH